MLLRFQVVSSNPLLPETRGSVRFYTEEGTLPDDDGWTIRYPVRSLPPKRAHDLRDICVWFHDYGDATSFQVNYLIYGEGLKEPAAGDLHVVVEVVRQDGGNAVGGGPMS